jgi:hypothetical protein
MLSGHDDAVGVMANRGMRPSRSQLYFTAAMAIGVVNGVVGGAAVALAVDLALAISLGVAVAAEVAAALIAVILALGYQRSRRGSGTGHQSLFPAEPAG